MNKNLRNVLIGIAVLIVLLFGAFSYLQYQTKQASPEATISTTVDGVSVDIFYNRPSKRERVIFGELVPYGETWRTGANEATTFTTDGPLTISGQTLPAGEYTLWTVPGPEMWEVIWNSKDYRWGVNFDSKASRQPEYDVVKVTVPAQFQPQVTEMFTIEIQGNNLILAWDQTRVSVPIGSESNT